MGENNPRGFILYGPNGENIKTGPGQRNRDIFVSVSEPGVTEKTARAASSTAFFMGAIAAGSTVAVALVAGVVGAVPELVLTSLDTCRQTWYEIRSTPEEERADPYEIGSFVAALFKLMKE